MLFSIGDTGGFMVNGFDIAYDSQTFSQPSGQKFTASIGQGYSSPGDKYAVRYYPNPSLASGVDKADKRFVINFVKKKDLEEDTAIVLLTDGLQQSPDWLRFVSNPISPKIKNVRGAIADIYERALKWDMEIGEKYSQYSPDDKSIVIIKKSQPVGAGTMVLSGVAGQLEEKTKVSAG
jgi:hypothetical protein